MEERGKSLLETLQRRVVLWDGGMGTALLSRGLPTGTPAETWTLERREDVESVHRAFYGVGSDLVQTNTFGANRPRLEAFRLGSRLREFNLTAARIALEACPDGRWVIGNLGPTGSAPPEAGVIEGACEEQAGLLEEGGVHALHIETLGGRVEALAALRGARAGSSLPILVSVTLRADEKSFLTLAGDDPLDVWRALQEGGADAVGANCLLEGPDLARALRSYRRHISVPFIAQPARQVRGAPTGRFVDSVGDLIRSGANGIGGCCGIDADDIAAAGGIIKEMADGA